MDKDLLGDFRILHELGRGGMGVVYEAEQLALHRRVALKVLPADFTRHPTALARFHREAQAAARLRHPGIVEVYSVGQEGDTHYFAMALIAGLALDKLLAQAREAPQRAAEVFREALGPAAETAPLWRMGYIAAVVHLIAQVADALDHAHAAGVIHRDIKPGNILVRADGSSVVTDFGLARDESREDLTRTGEMAGTVYYLSPEQALARRVRLDHRTDVFSLGVTLYEALTHQRPFEGETSQDVIQQIVTREPIDPQKLNRQLPADLAAIALKAMEKDPDRRYRTAGEMAEDLRAFLAHRPVVARKVSAPARVLRWVKRERLKAALGLVLLLALPPVAGLGGYVLATQVETRAGTHLLHQERLEALLQKGFQWFGTTEPAKAIPPLEQALALDPECTEALGGIALGRWFEGGGNADRRVAMPYDGSPTHVVDDFEGGTAAAVAFLDRNTAHVARSRALQRIRARLFESKNQNSPVASSAADSALGPPVDAVDFFLCAVWERIRQARQHPDAAQRWLAYAHMACMTARAWRLQLHVERFEAALAAGDARAAVEGLDAFAARRNQIPADQMARLSIAMPTRPEGTIVQILARSYAHFGEDARALALLRHEPSSTPGNREVRIQVLRRHDPTQARAELERWAQESDDLAAWRQLAWLLVDPDSTARDPAAGLAAARHAVERTVAKDPARARSERLLAEALHATGERAAAIELLTRVRQRVPRDQDADLDRELRETMERFRAGAASQPAASATQPTWAR